MFPKLLTIFLSLFLLASTSFAATPQTPKKPRVVLMPIIVSEEDRSLAGSMENALVEGLQDRYIVYSGDSVKQKMDEIFKKESGKTECDQTKCMQDIAMAFQTDLLAAANVTKKSTGYFISINIQNIVDHKVIYTKSLSFKNSDEFEIIEKLKELVISKSDQMIVAPIVVDRNDPEGALWLEVKSSNTIDEYNAFIQAYPNGKYISLANAGIQKIKDDAKAITDEQESQFWITVQKENTEDSYNRYLKQYPKGKYTPLAEIRIKKIGLPAWLTSVPKSKDLFYTIGTVKLTGPINYSNDNIDRAYTVNKEAKNNLSVDELKKLAYDRALDAVAQSMSSDVTGMVKQFEMTTGVGDAATVEKANTVTYKIMSDGINDFGKIEQEYTAADGNYFVLISYPKNKIGMDKNRNILLKSYLEITGVDDNVITDRVYTYASKRGNIGDYEELIGGNAISISDDYSKMPKWTTDTKVTGLSITAVGSSSIYVNESLFLALQMAVGNARHELSKQIMSFMPKKKPLVFSSTSESPSSIDDLVAHSTDKLIQNTQLINSEVYQIYIGKTSVWVLVGMDKKALDETLKISKINNAKQK